MASSCNEDQIKYCPHDKTKLDFGIALIPGVTQGLNDFIGSDDAVTMYIDPKETRLGRVLKCPVCGYSEVINA